MISQDRNFDDLIDNFSERICSTEKGSWRIKLLKEDISSILPIDANWNILDAGCGMGQMALWLAQRKPRHQLTLCDLSEKMLGQAKQSFQNAGIEATFIQGAVQELAKTDTDFDLVLFHAVMEWMANPISGLESVISRVKSGGLLSLMFYNRNAMVYANVLKGQWRLKPILEDSYIGKGNKLSPPNPQYPNEITSLLEKSGLTIVKHTGIRVFHDYMTPEVLKKTDEKELFKLESQYCRMPVYRDMGRYVHILAKK